MTIQLYYKYNDNYDFNAMQPAVYREAILLALGIHDYCYQFDEFTTSSSKERKKKQRGIH